MTAARHIFTRLLAPARKLGALCAPLFTRGPTPRGIPSPAANTSSPARGGPAPALSIPAPILSGPAPAISIPAPSTSKPDLRGILSPACGIPSPAANTSSPARGVPTPALSIPAPVLSGPAPAASAPALALRAIPALAFLLPALFIACSNGELPYPIDDPPIPEYIPLDDTSYPYAGLPRIIIETTNHRAIDDCETEVPARLQIWGPSAPETEEVDLTIRGRGNTSWSMPKKSYKIEFAQKQTILNMPANRDWALIANYADKSMLKNFLMFKLSSTLGLYYTPRNAFVELFINGSYYGVYQLTETIKVDENRINIPKEGNSYLAELDFKHKDDEPFVITSLEMPIRIHSPKNADDSVLARFSRKIDSFESYLINRRPGDSLGLAKWLSVDDYIKHFWIQEFSRNSDAAFYSSIYFTWKENEPIRMGPVWDFDLSFGGHTNDSLNAPEGWLARDLLWNHFLFKDSTFVERLNSYWAQNRQVFEAVLDTIDVYSKALADAADNNYRRWDALTSTYSDAIDELKAWIKKRSAWIDQQILGD